MPRCKRECCEPSNRWHKTRALMVVGNFRVARMPTAFVWGDYRVIYTADDAVLIVAVEKVRHRRDVYR